MVLFKKPLTLAIFLLVTCVFLVSCKGETTVTPALTNQEPSIQIGSDQSVNENATATLSASATDQDGTIERYQWAQTTGISVVLNNANTQTPEFTAPSVNTDETLTFQLTVTDNEGATSSDTLKVTVLNQLTVGGTVSGLTGTLTLQNNGAATQSLQITTNGNYQFSQFFNNGEIYNITVSQQPQDQMCSVSNANGQINNINVTNVAILCTGNTPTVTLSGSYQTTPLLQLDNDINDPSAAPNGNNNTLDTPQAIQNLVLIQGFATAVATGRQVERDRFAYNPDPNDVYQVILQQNQSIRLQVVDFAGADVFKGDLDLYLYDNNRSLVGSSLSVTEFENITVPSDGQYYIVVHAYSGTSKYTLSLNAVSQQTHSSQSVEFQTEQAIIQLKPTANISRFTSSNKDLTADLNTNTARSTLATFSVSAVPVSQAKNNTSGTPSETLSFDQVLAAANPTSFKKVKTLQHIKQLNQQPDVLFAEPNYLYQPLLVPNDSYYARQWHYPAINLPQAWDITTGSRTGSDVIVAVIDTGVFLTHSDLAGQLVSGYDFISSSSNAGDGNGIDNNPDDPGDSTQLNNSSWHGTHVAGTVAAKTNNNNGVAGVSWHAKIMPIRVLGLNGGTSYDIIQAVRFASGLSNDSNTVPTQKADIINLSLGCANCFSQAEQQAYTDARAQGVIVVAAAGNNNSSQLFYPASFDGVVSVSATDFSNNKAYYSNFGSRVDVAAPGGDMRVDSNGDGSADGVLSTLVDDSTGIRESSISFYQGTSMASPHVAGVLALMRALYPALSPDDVDNLLAAGAITTDLGTAGRDNTYGYGLIDALKATQQAQQLANGGTTPDLPPVIVATPTQLSMGLNSESTLTITNEGKTTTSITSINTEASWLSVSATNVDANGLGEYRVQINRTGLSDAAYQSNIIFNLATGSSVSVHVSMQVAQLDTTGRTASIYVMLLDSNNNVISKISPTDQGNGQFSYRFSNIVAGSYRIIGSSDIDNDQQFCQYAEACGGYPTLNALSPIEVTNQDIADLDFIIGIQSNFGQ